MRCKAGMLGGNRAKAWELPSVRYVRALSVASRSTTLRDVTLGNNGHSLYVTDNGKVHQYALSNPEDISTASHVASLDINPESLGFVDGLGITGSAFKPDGTRLYVVGYNGTILNGQILEYTLGGAWDVSTATFLQSFETVDANSQKIFPASLTFSADGTVAIAADSRNNSVFRYNLGNAWDISTSSFSSSISVSGIENQLTGATVGDGGRQLYIIGLQYDTVYQYRLSVMWDVSTAVLANSKSIASQDGSAHGIAFNSYGTAMYIAGDQNNSIYEYSLV